MPRLYSIEQDFDRDHPRYVPTHFFPSAEWRAHWSSSQHAWYYDLNTDFPARCYIHNSKLSSTSTDFWVPLRKDVERRWTGDCFVEYTRWDYRYWWNKNATEHYDREYEHQSHGYWTFYFEDEADQTWFIMHNGDKLSPKKYRFHPDYGVSCMDDRYDVDWTEDVPGAYRV